MLIGWLDLANSLTWRNRRTLEGKRKGFEGPFFCWSCKSATTNLFRILQYGAETFLLDMDIHVFVQIARTLAGSHNGGSIYAPHLLVWSPLEKWLRPYIPYNLGVWSGRCAIAHQLGLLNVSGCPRIPEDPRVSEFLWRTHGNGTSLPKFGRRQILYKQGGEPHFHAMCSLECSWFSP